MQRREITSHIRAYEFDDLPGYKTYAYVVVGCRGIYLIDTFMGQDAVTQILEAEDLVQVDIIAINTHFHFDHVWGNSHPRIKEVYGHEITKDLMVSHRDQEVRLHGQHAMGIFDLRLPTETFRDQMVLEPGLNLYYTPGHTRDSISLYDERSKVLMVGDNLELPLPYLEDKDLEKYLNSLKHYRDLKPSIILAGHSIMLDIGILDETTTYLELLNRGETMTFKSDAARKVHEENLKHLKEVAVDEEI